MQKGEEYYKRREMQIEKLEVKHHIKLPIDPRAQTVEKNVQKCISSYPTSLPCYN